MKISKTAEKVRDILLEEFYLDDNGDVRRAKDGYHGRFKKGDLANFFVGTNDYLRFQIPRVRGTMPKHHLVMVLSGYEIPYDKEVDHIDGNKRNNKIENLRIVSRTTNTKNRKKRSDNTSGITGIRWSEYHQHYVIRRTVNGKRLSRSRKTLPEAIKVLEEITKLDSAYTERHGK